jgi:L-iditol 2-dehydrogenase
MVGVVEAADASNSGLQPGDKALTLAPGLNAMSEYFLAPVEDVLPLPDKYPLQHYLQAQQLGTVVYACKHIPVDLAGKDVVVIGQGSAGLWFNSMLRRQGARRLIGVDLEPHRLTMSPHYGATHTVHNAGADLIEAVTSILDGSLADVVIEAAGEVDSINLACELVRSHGFLLYFGIPHKRNIPFNFGRFFGAIKIVIEMPS